MRKKFVFATNNSHKLEEVTAILGEKVELLSMKDIKCDTDIPETADTLEGNALLKARYIFDNYHLDCFADDTGLEVEALGGAPGVYSARYAGDALLCGLPCCLSAAVQPLAQRLSAERKSTTDN